MEGINTRTPKGENVATGLVIPDDVKRKTDELGRELIEAVRWRDYEKAEALLKDGALEFIICEGKTPLLFVASSDRWQHDNLRMPCFKSTRQKNQQMFDFLLDKGANVKATDDRGWTALHYTTRAGRLAATSRLLDLGAQLDATTKSGETPLHTAVHDIITEDHPKVIELLIEKKLPVDAVDSEGFTALHRTVSHTSWLAPAVTDSLRALAKGGADVSKRKVTSRPHIGLTPLQRAVTQYHEDTKAWVKLLIELGANPEEIKDIGMSAEERFKADERADFRDLLGGWFSGH